MRLTILGSGTAIPNAERFPAGVLIEVEEEGRSVAYLVDVGPGTLRRLAAAGVGLEALRGVLLTHYHTDHTADLPALLFALRNPRYAGRPPLRVLAAPGLIEFVGHLTAAWPWLAPKGGYRLELTEIEPGRHTLGRLAVTAVAIEHTAQSLAYRIEVDGAVAAISGDAAPCEGLVEVAQGADLFVCECSFPDAHAVEGHLTPRSAAEAAHRAGVGQLCLTHFYPECEGHDLTAEARAAYQGPLVLAEDLMRFELGAAPA